MLTHIQLKIEKKNGNHANALSDQNNKQENESGNYYSERTRKLRQRKTNKYQKKIEPRSNDLRNYHKKQQTKEPTNQNTETCGKHSNWQKIKTKHGNVT